MTGAARPSAETAPASDRIMADLPDEALVVRGGQNLPSSFEKGAGVRGDKDGRLRGLSVNAAPGASLADLTAPTRPRATPESPIIKSASPPSARSGGWEDR